MSTAFTVRTVARPVNDDIFDDLDIKIADMVSIDPPDWRFEITVDRDLTPEEVVRCKCRLLTVDGIGEEYAWLTYQARRANTAFLDGGEPTLSGMVAQVQAVTEQMNALMHYQFPDIDA